MAKKKADPAAAVEEKIEAPSDDFMNPPVEADDVQQEEAAAEPAAKKESKAKKDPAAGADDFKKGVEYVAREVLAIYDKADGKPTGKNVYKFDKVKAEAVESKGGRVWLKIDGGFVCAKEGDAVYF